MAPLRRFFPALVVLASAGCLAATTPEAASPDAYDEALWGCDDVTFFAFPPLDHVQSLLPEPFVAVDATQWMVPGFPTPLGRGLVSASALSCEGARGAAGPVGVVGNAILVEPPAFEHEALDTEGIAAYLAGYYTSDAAHHAWAASRAHDFHLAEVATTIEPSGPGARVTLTIRDAQGLAGRFEGIVGGETATPAGKSSTWQQDARGLLHYHIAFPARPFASGEAVSCTLREGSHLARIFGATTCAGQRVAVVVALDDDYTGTWTHLPGARVDDA